MALFGCAADGGEQKCLDRCDDVGGEQAVNARRAELQAFYEGGQFGSFIGQPRDDESAVKIRYVTYPAENEVGAIVFVNGRTESLPKYMELYDDLNRNGYTIYAMDHRGQGLSGRLLPDPLRGHLDSFDKFDADFAQFMDTVVLPAGHDKLFALSHSMGGAVLTRYLADNPSTFRAAVLSSPMYGINFPVPELVILLKVKILNNESYAAGADETAAIPPFEGNKLTTSEERYKFAIEWVHEEYPQTRLGSPTNGWVAEAISATRALRDRAEDLALPITLMQGSDDTIVANERHDEVCEEAPECKVVAFGSAKHELLIERDSIRTKAIDTILNFFALHSD